MPDIDESKAGAGSVDPDDFNTLVDAVKTLQDGGGGGGGAAGAFLSADLLITEEATADSLNLAITGADTGTGTFTVAGDHAADFYFNGTPFVVTGSTGNDTHYTVSSATFDTDHTDIVTNEGVGDATADGFIQYGRYTATLPVLAGTVVLDVIAYALGVWNASGGSDKAVLYVGDDNNPNGFYDAVDLKAMSSVYDASSLPDVSYAVMNGPTVSGNGLYTGAPYVSNTSGNIPGPGVRYATDDTLTVKVIATLASPPITPEGVTLVKVIYFAPIDAVPVVFA